MAGRVRRHVRASVGRVGLPGGGHGCPACGACAAFAAWPVRGAGRVSPVPVWARWRGHEGALGGERDVPAFTQRGCDGRPRERVQVRTFACVPFALACGVREIALGDLVRQTRIVRAHVHARRDVGVGGGGWGGGVRHAQIVARRHPSVQTTTGSMCDVPTCPPHTTGSMCPPIRTCAPARTHERYPTSSRGESC